MIIDLDLCKIFIHVPKTGGTSFCRLYNVIRADNNLPSVPETNTMPAYHGHTDPDIGFVHHTISHLINELGDLFVDSFDIHSMVRDPWHWVFSRYIWFINNPKMFSKAFAYESLDQATIRTNLAAYRNLGFKNWLLNSHTNQWAHEMHLCQPWPDEQKLSQSFWLCKNDELRVDNVHKLEDRFVRINKKKYYLPIENQRARAINDYAQLFNKSMTDECISFIEETCAWEIENFGYRFERMRI